MHIVTCTVFETSVSGGPAGASGCSTMSCKWLDYEMWPMENCGTACVINEIHIDFEVGLLTHCGPVMQICVNCIFALQLWKMDDAKLPFDTRLVFTHLITQYLENFLIWSSGLDFKKKTWLYFELMICDKYGGKNTGPQCVK
jgi:hypothetical protein